MTKRTYAPILVTGASSGIGNCIARHLAEHGHTVYGTVRNREDFEKLSQIDRVTPLLVDVTNSQQVKDAVEHVTGQGLGLYGLVNNAGIGELGMLSTWTDADLHHIFNVNVFGPHRVTNAFLPLLLESKGRIVNIGSRGGMLSKAYYGPYTMTKHAMEAYTKALNDELQPYGVRAAVIQPGGVETSIGETSLPGTIARFRSTKPPFTEEAEHVLQALTAPRDEVADDVEESESNRKPSTPTVVAEAVSSALFSEHPKLRYLVATKWEIEQLIDSLIERLLDENDNPRFSYSRDEMIERLSLRISERDQQGMAGTA